jgi:PhzF family phenazine biosynthesis protein
MLPIFHIDSFTELPFQGNPAGVCILDNAMNADWMQRIATEMNLSETAFPLKSGDHFALRWFTPAIEVDLCGHATLAAAHALWSEDLADSNQPIHFETRSGRLSAARTNSWIDLDFPSTRPVPAAPPEGLFESLGLRSGSVWKSRFDYLVVVDDEETVRSLTPDFNQLSSIGDRGVIVTSRSKNFDFDFVSRFFAPAVGINEDPVTGSAHCCLAPYWSSELKKNQLIGFQASSRGGIVRTTVKGDRVILGGHAVTVFRGQLSAEACELSAAGRF